MNMLGQVLLGLLMTAFTVILGALTIAGAAEPLRRNRRRLVEEAGFLSHLIALTLIALWLVVGIMLAVTGWAVLFLGLDVFSDFPTSLYFAMISFTTVGYGDVVPPAEWRILAAFVSVDGFLLFGLNTAFVFEVLRRMRDR